MTETTKSRQIAMELFTKDSFSKSDVRELLLLPILAVASALVLGGLFMWAVGIDVATISIAFTALVSGSIGSVQALSETLSAAIPLTLAALGIAVGFRAGLFNIGAEGQMLIGGMAAVFVGFHFTGLPAYLHLPLAVLAGACAGAFWAAIAGFLRARTGAHEVITTIMLNLIALKLVEYLLRNPPFQQASRSDPISETILPTAALPQLLDWLDPNMRLHAGIFLALFFVAVIYFLLFHTRLGFEFRSVGANPDAARYAGMRSGALIIAAMALSGALAGLAGANQILGILERATPGFSSGIGFAAIAVALLGRGHPVGVLLAALLFGALEAGGRQMQASAGVSIDLISIVQALIVVFIAAPILVRKIFSPLFPSPGKPLG